MSKRSGQLDSPKGFQLSPPDLAVCQNLEPLVNIKIDCKWMFIPLKMVLIGIDPYPFEVPLVYKQHAGTHLPV
jgi:hypothetical protein